LKAYGEKSLYQIDLAADWEIVHKFFDAAKVESGRIKAD